MARLLAAMSGGVDSSVAAALAVRGGHDVTGMTLKQWEFPDEESRLSKGCCTLDAMADARRVADILGIPHYTIDFRDVFAREVVDPWVESYVSGRTPNPCVRCNERVRFGALLRKAEALGYQGIVTGHWVRTTHDRDRCRLWRSRNPDKDQSYVLYRLSQEQLAKAHFPLGEFASKDEVRSLARYLGLPNHSREDSVDVCFVGVDRAPGDVVAERAPEAVRSGPILDSDGHEIGRHRGLAYYTVGQRRGLGVALGRPAYVTALLPERNAVVVGEGDRLGCSALEATDARWLSGRPPASGTAIEAVVRYRATPVPATVTTQGDSFRVDFHEPVRAVAPGQAVVLYSGDEVIGGGTIAQPR